MGFSLDKRNELVDGIHAIVQILHASNEVHSSYIQRFHRITIIHLIQHTDRVLHIPHGGLLRSIAVRFNRLPDLL